MKHAFRWPLIGVFAAIAVTTAIDAGGLSAFSALPLFPLTVLFWYLGGLLRLISGSVLVASLSHGVWNGGAYAFFGFGAKVGALGIKDTAIYGPEVGILGLALNLVFAALLWHWWKASLRPRGPEGVAPETASKS